MTRLAAIRLTFAGIVAAILIHFGSEGLGDFVRFHGLGYGGARFFYDGWITILAVLVAVTGAYFWTTARD